MEEGGGDKRNNVHCTSLYGREEGGEFALTSRILTRCFRDNLTILKGKGQCYLYLNF